MNHLLPETYCRSLEEGGSGLSNVEQISRSTARAETMMVGLRLLHDGVDAETFARRHGVTLEETYGPVIDDLVATGFMVRDQRGVHLTPRGLMLANDVAERFL